LGNTGQTYSQVPQPVHLVSSILIPTPMTIVIAWGSQRSKQAKQPQLLARHFSLRATARMFSNWDGTKSAVSRMVGRSFCGTFKASVTVVIASPREYRLFLKKSLRLMSIALPSQKFYMIYVQKYMTEIETHP
jgi:hypothetical protein